MSGAQDRPDDGGVQWEDRSIYEACVRCGCMVATDVDRARHIRWHATLSRAFGEAAGGQGG